MPQRRRLGVSTLEADAGRLRTLVGSTVGGAGTGPANAQYLVLATHSDLTDERVATPGDGLAGTDAGAGSTYTLAVGAGTGIAVNANDVALSHLGLESLADPNDDRIFFWDDGAGGSAWLDMGAGAVITGTTLSVNHDAATNFVGDEHVDHTGVTLTAGAGLTGGGTIAASRTFDVIAGDGIVVAANSVAVDLVAAWSGLEFSGGDLRVDLDAVFVWTALHTFNAGIDVDGTLEFQGAESITTTSGNLTIAPVGDVIFNPTGNDLLPTTNYDLNIGSISKKYLTLHAAELWVETLVAQDTIATIGGRILVGPTTVLTADLGSGAGDTTITVKHNQMSNGDRVVMQANGKLEWMSIDSGAGGGAGAYTYTVTRDLDTTGRNLWYAGDAVFNTGTTGDGFIDLYSIAGITAGSTAGPTIVGNVRNSATFNDYTEHWAIGNLDGIYGYGVTTYGAAFGEYSTSDYVTIDSTNGVRFLDSSDTVQAQLTGAVWTIGEVAAGKSNIEITAGELNLRNNTTDMITLTTDGAILINQWGAAFFSRADGLLLLGPACPIAATSWTSLRGQAATISGAFHQEAGRWVGTRGLVVEQAALNYCANPRMYDGDSSDRADTWAVAASVTGAETYSVIAHPVARFGWLQRIEYTGIVTDGNKYSGLSIDTAAASFAAADDCTISVDISIGIGSIATARIVVIARNNVGAAIATELTNFTVTGTTLRYEHTFSTLPANTDHVTVRVEAYGIDDGETVDIRFGAVNIEKKAYSTSFCSGNLGTGYAWGGDDDDSASTRTATEVNLDAHVGLLNDNTAFSFSVWVQMPYDYDAMWPTDYMHIVRAYKDVDENLYLQYDGSGGGQQFRAFYIDAGGSQVIESQLTFSAGDWVHLFVNYDTTGDLELFVNGVLGDSADLSARSAQTGLTDWNLGSEYDASNQGGFNVCEFAPFDRVLTANEVAAVFHRQGPLVDAGALDTPGIYIVDGKFRMASSTANEHTEITAAGIGIYDGTGPTGVGRILGGFVNTTSKELDITSSDLGWFGYDSSDVLQVAWYGSGADAGKILAGAGVVELNADGLQIEVTTSFADARSYKFVDGSDNTLGIIKFQDSASQHYMQIGVNQPNSSDDALMYLYAISDAGSESYVLLEAKTHVVDVTFTGVSAGVYSGNATYGTSFGVSGDVRIAGGIFAGANLSDPSVGAIQFEERSSDPTEPSEGEAVIWMSDGTGKGDDGNVMIASKAGGTTNYATLFDHSAGAGW